MWKSPLVAMMVFAPMSPVSGEVEYEIHAGFSSGDCFGTGAKSCRLLELRTYHAAPGKFDALLARFRDHTTKLFDIHCMRNVCYWVPVDNKDMDAATKSWADFRADSDWVAAKKAYEDKAGGSLTTEGGVVSVFLKPTDFSPVK